MATSETIAELFSRHPIERLTPSNRTRLLGTVTEAFSTEDQHRFVARFYAYVRHDQPSDHVVDLDAIWRWLGFSRKDLAKRKLAQNFTEPSDYSSAPAGVGGGRAAQQGGHNRDIVLMTVETFKALCLLASTDQGAEVRSCYIRMEAMVHSLVQEQTAELHAQLAATRATSEALQLRIAQTTRKYSAAIRGEVTYIFRESDTMHKIGQTGDLRQREATSSTFSFSGTMCHAVPCVNAKLLEAVVHHMLDKRRMAKRREWFEVTLDEAKAAVEAAQLLLDNFMEAPEQLVQLLPLLQQAQRELCPDVADIEDTRAAKRLRISDQDADYQAARDEPCPAHLVRFEIPDLKNKRVAQYTLEGEHVATWESAMEAWRKLDIGCYSKIRACVQGLQNQAGGFCWRHVEGTIIKEVPFRDNGAYRQLRPDGTFVNSYTSMLEASNAAGVEYYRIRKAFEGKEEVKGYVWHTDVALRAIKGAAHSTHSSVEGGQSSSG